MKYNHMIITGTLIALVLFLHSSTVSAVSVGGKSFGGKIISIKSAQIQALEAAGFTCIVPGTTITMLPSNKLHPREYLIPSGVTNRGGFAPSIAQSILGLYGITKTTITCTSSSVPPVTKTVTLSVINYFGTSRK